MNNIENLCLRDPFVFFENGIYYVYGTYKSSDSKKGFYGFKSNNLEEFEDAVNIFFASESWGDKVFWAPELKKYNGLYYLFGTVRKRNENLGTYIFVSDHPLGNFKPVSNESITPKAWSCLDGHLFIENNIPYLVFCREWTEVKDGEMYIVELSKDLTERVSEPILLFKASEAQWCSPIFGDGYVTDGPFLYKYDDEYRMLWSSFHGSEYCISVISSKELLSGWKQETIPYLSTNVGHGMLFEENNKIYLVCHGPNGPSGQERIIKILFDENASRYKLL